MLLRVAFSRWTTTALAFLVLTMMVTLCESHVITWDTFESPPRQKTYIPKSRRYTNRLMQEFCGLLKSWIKKMGCKVEKAITAIQTKKRKHQPMHWTRVRHRAKHRHKLLPLMIAMHALQARTSTAFMFDTDSRMLRVDNCATYCISNRIEDFDGPLKKINRKIKGFGGTVDGLMVGTV